MIATAEGGELRFGRAPMWMATQALGLVYEVQTRLHRYRVRRALAERQTYGRALTERIELGEAALSDLMRELGPLEWQPRLRVPSEAVRKRVMASAREAGVDTSIPDAAVVDPEMGLD